MPLTEGLMSLLFLLNPQNPADVGQKDAITFTWL